jgi:hypothetical protein
LRRGRRGEEILGTHGKAASGVCGARGLALCSEKFAKFETIAINSLAHLSERQRRLPALYRLQIFFGGHMPRTDSLPYAWYETPNIYFCSIKDFRELRHAAGAFSAA